MNKKSLLLLNLILPHLLCILLMSSQSVYADEDEGGSAKIGPNQAITKADPHRGIQLSEEAVRTLGLRFHTVTGTGTCTIPISALVHFQNEIGIYRFRDRWFKLLEIQILSKTATQVTVKSKELSPQDRIVTEGVPLLRVANLEATDGAEEGHGH